MNRKPPANVKAVFDSIPPDARKQLLQIRDLILDCASNDKTIGKLTETLKWGEPAYLTEKTGSGSTIRLGYKDDQPGTVAVYFNCQTTIVDQCQQRHPDIFDYQKNRALLIPIDLPLPADELSECIEIALRYHLDKQ